MYGNIHSLANLYSLQAAEDGNRDSKGKADVYTKRASELQKKILDSLWHHPSPEDAFVFYKKRGSIDDPFFYSRLAGDNLYTGGVVDQLSLVRGLTDRLHLPCVFFHAPSCHDESIRYCMEAVR